MINIKNINIVYDQPLILESTLEIEDGKITVIKGKSGIGKTSLLSIVGLTKKDSNIIYQFNDTIISHDDASYADFRKHHIGYVFQESYLFQHLNIYENIRLFATIAGVEMNRQLAQTLLETVHLDKNLTQAITTLSGGEKQRLAIACALAKKPDLLILDEPTSALDHKNMQLLMDVLKKLACQGTMILMASHDLDAIQQCDVIYEIKHQKLMKMNQQSTQKNDLLKQTRKKIPFSFYINYAINYLKQHPMFQISSFAILGLVISLVTGLFFITKQFNQNVASTDSQQLFISYSQDSKYHADLPEIDDWIVEKIKDIRYCTDIFPLYEATVTAINELLENGYVVQPYNDESVFRENANIISIEKHGIYTKKDFKSEALSLSLIMPDGQTHEIVSLPVSGIINEQYMDLHSDSKNIIYVPFEKLPSTSKVQMIACTVADETTLFTCGMQIKNIDPTLDVYNQSTRNKATQFEINEMIQTFAPLMIASMMLMSILLISLSFSKYIENRKLEINLLKVNGLNKKEVTQLIFSECCVQTTMISLLASLFTFILYKIMQKVLSVSLTYSILSRFILLFLICLILLSIPTLITLHYFQKQDISEAMRN